MNNAPKLPPDVGPILKQKREKKVQEPEAQVNNDPYDKKKWENRRRMAWTSLTMMILLTLALIGTALFTDIDMQRLKPIAEPLAWSYLGFTSVIGAYMGFTTYASVKNGKSRRRR